jgi:FkbM family methyltransferase
MRCNWRMAQSLARAGVRWSSIAFYPLRRRLPRGLNRLEMRNGASFTTPPREALLGIFEEVWLQQRYLPSGAEVRDNGTIVDIGANAGVFAVWAAKRFPQGRVIALEPAAEMFGYLRRNLDASGASNVVAANLACAGRTGQVTLYTRGEHGLNSLYQKDVYGSAFAPLAAVEAVSLDELFARFSVERCELLKLDCEGAEYEILMGASPATLGRIRSIALEYHLGMNEHSPQELAAFLDRHGFRVTVGAAIDEENGYLYAAH